MTRSNNTEQAQSTQVEQQMLQSLTGEQLRLVATWLHEEAFLRSPEYSEEVYNTLRCIAHRLEILAKDAGRD